MRNIISYLVVIILIVQTCLAQNRINLVNIKEREELNEVVYIPIRDTFRDNAITIYAKPVTPESLNDVFQFNASLNGKFTYSHFTNSRDSYFLKRKQKRIDKSDFDLLNEGLDYLANKEIITADEVEALNEQILDDFSEQHFASSDITFANPYLLGDTYMTVFRLELSNNTDSVVNFNERLVLKSGTNSLIPLTSDWLIDALTNLGALNKIKAFSLERFNLTEQLILPPKSTIVKYVSFLPVDTQNETITLYFDKTNAALSWKQHKSTRSVEQVYTFYELPYNFSLSPEDDYLINASRQYVLLNPLLQIVSDKMYIEEADKNKVFEMFSYFLHGSTLYYAREKFSPADYFDFENKRRKRFIIKVTKINGVARKVNK